MSSPVLVSPSSSSSGNHHAPGGDGQRPIRRRHAVDGRMRSGCTTCKARRKKCDGHVSKTDNRCKACVRLGLVCEWLPLRRVPARPRVNPSQCLASSSYPGDLVHGPGESSLHLDSGENHARLGPSPISPIPGLGHRKGATLLRYFLDRAAPMCSILQRDGYRFCSVLLPMAFCDSSLLNAVLTYALIHSDTKKIAPGDNNVLPQTRLQFETQVAQGMSKAIARKSVSESTIASALVISLADVADGDTSRWQLHLQGAGHFISHLSAKRLLQTSDGAFLLRNFAYHDIMASLSNGRRPHIEGVYWVEKVEATVESADSFMGLAHHILRHISGICSFVADTSDLDVHSSGAKSQRLSRELIRGHSMARALNSQRLHLSPTLEEKDNNTDALFHHAEAFRNAALVHLYRQLLRLGGSNATYESAIEACVQQILEHVSMIPTEITCEIGLLFPLFMAGVAGGHKPATVGYVRSRYKNLENWSNFRHITRARELLEMLWNEGRSDWQVKLKELGWKLSLG